MASPYPNAPLPPRQTDWHLTAEEAAELRAVLDAPAGSPGKLRLEPKALPVAGVSLPDEREGGV